MVSTKKSTALLIAIAAMRVSICFSITIFQWPRPTRHPLAQLNQGSRALWQQLRLMAGQLRGVEQLQDAIHEGVLMRCF
jgi:hypothetical protein